MNTIIALFLFFYSFILFIQPALSEQSRWPTWGANSKRNNFNPNSEGPYISNTYYSSSANWNLKPFGTVSSISNVFVYADNTIILLNNNPPNYSNFPVSNQMLFLNLNGDTIFSIKTGFTFYVAVAPSDTTPVVACLINFATNGVPQSLPPTLYCYNMTSLVYSLEIPQLINHKDFNSNNYMISMDFISSQNLLITNRGSTVSGNNTFVLFNTVTGNISWIANNLFMSGLNGTDYDQLYPPTIFADNIFKNSYWFIYTETYGGSPYLTGFQVDQNNFLKNISSIQTPPAWSYNYSGYFNSNSNPTVPMVFDNFAYDDPLLVIGVTGLSSPNILINLDLFTGALLDTITFDATITGYSTAAFYNNGFIYVTTVSMLYGYYFTSDGTPILYWKMPFTDITSAPSVDYMQRIYFTQSGSIYGYEGGNYYTPDNIYYYQNSMMYGTSIPPIPLEDELARSYLLVTYNDGSIGLYGTQLTPIPTPPVFPLQPLSDFQSIIMGSTLGGIYLVTLIGAIVAVCLFKKSHQPTRFQNV